MAFHVVTNRCFLACEKVTSVVIEELIPDRPAPRRKRKKSKRYGAAKKAPAAKIVEIPRQYTISISYYPLALNSQQYNNNNGSREEFSMDLRVIGKNEAYALYAEIIKEVQEQHPGEGYLDKLVNKMLEGADFKLLEPQVIPSDDD